METAQSPLEPCSVQRSLRGGRWVCVTSIWEIENVGNSWKKSSAVLQILRGKSQPTPDVDMVDLEHMKCCGFNSCSQSAFFLTLWQLPGEKHIFTSGERWVLGAVKLHCRQCLSVCRKKSLIIHFIFNGIRQEFSHSEDTNSPTTDQLAPDKIEINSYSGLSIYEIVKSSTS